MNVPRNIRKTNAQKRKLLCLPYFFTRMYWQLLFFLIPAAHMFYQLLPEIVFRFKQ